MTGIINLITDRLVNVNLSNPLSVLDLIVVIFLMVSFLIYIKRFPIFRVFLGVLFLILCSLIFLAAGLILTALVFGIISNLILLSLPLIFAPEIRHYLEKLGRLPFQKFPLFTDKHRKAQVINDLANSVYELGAKNTGATIVIQRRTGLGETIETGTELDAKLSIKLLENLFFHKSPLHDGAVVLNEDRIVAAGCLLPIHGDVKLEPPFGTRHRAGLAITKDTDAVVILVSEQRGKVSLAENGKLFSNLEKSELVDKLTNLL